MAYATNSPRIPLVRSKSLFENLLCSWVQWLHLPSYLKTHSGEIDVNGVKFWVKTILNGVMVQVTRNFHYREQTRM